MCPFPNACFPGMSVTFTTEYLATVDAQLGVRPICSFPESLFMRCLLESSRSSLSDILLAFIRPPPVPIKYQTYCTAFAVCTHALACSLGSSSHLDVCTVCVCFSLSWLRVHRESQLFVVLIISLGVVSLTPCPLYQGVWC